MGNGRYMAIPPEAIVPGVLPEFKIYFLSSKGRYVLWALDGNKVSPEQLGKLSESGMKEVFVDLEDKFRYEQYLENNLDKILDNKLAQDDQKAAIFSQVSANVVKNAFETSLGLGAMGSDSMARTQRMVQNALIFIAESKSLYALTKMIGHDYQTYKHATKVLWFTVMFLRENQEVMEVIHPGYGETDDAAKREILRQCGVAALLHDIGKAFIAREILNKSGPLTELEWEMMKRHPLSGLAMLLDTDVPDFVRKAVLHHHEDFQGTGYPMGFEGLNITILARVLRIVDVFDAITSRRPYKEPVSPGKAIQIMIGKPSNNNGDETSGQDKRDLGMKGCFDERLLQKFIVFLGNVKMN